MSYFTRFHIHWDYHWLSTCSALLILYVIAQYPLILPGPLISQCAKNTRVPTDPLPSVQWILFSPSEAGITSTVRIVPKVARPTSNLPPIALGVSAAQIFMPQTPEDISVGLVLSQIGLLPDESIGHSLKPRQLHVSLGSGRRRAVLQARQMRRTVAFNNCIQIDIIIQS